MRPALRMRCADIAGTEAAVKRRRRGGDTDTFVTHGPGGWKLDVDLAVESAPGPESGRTSWWQHPTRPARTRMPSAQRKGEHHSSFVVWPGKARGEAGRSASLRRTALVFAAIALSFSLFAQDAPLQIAITLAQARDWWCRRCGQPIGGARVKGLPQDASTVLETCVAQKSTLRSRGRLPPTAKRRSACPHHPGLDRSIDSVPRPA